MKDESIMSAPLIMRLFQMEWRLTGCAEHVGPHVKSGHLVAYKEKSGVWRKYDDEKVTRTDAEEVNFALLAFKLPSTNTLAEVFLLAGKILCPGQDVSAILFPLQTQLRDFENLY